MINSLRDDDYDGSLLMFVVVVDDDAFDHLLNIPQDFSVVNEDGENIVYWIVYFLGGGDDVCSRRLMKLSQKTNVESFINRKEDRRGQTPLHRAAYHNDHRAIETIIKLGGDVNLKNNYNELPDEQDGCDDETKRIIRSSRKW